MRAEIIARNYAETLLSLAERHGGAVGAGGRSGRRRTSLAELLRSDPRFAAVPGDAAGDRPSRRRRALQQALAGRAPEMFVRFVMVLTDKRRQSLLPEIAARVPRAGG